MSAPLPAGFASALPKLAPAKDVKLDTQATEPTVIVAGPPPATATITEPVTLAVATAMTPASPARQIEPALVQIAKGADGDIITMRLDPVGLGHVQIRVVRDTAGVATVHVTVEQQDTLNLMLSDQQRLLSVLDNAGIPADGRMLNFALGNSGLATGSMPDNGAGSRPGARPFRNGPARGGGGETAMTDKSQWLRAGVDITA